MGGWEGAGCHAAGVCLGGQWYAGEQCVFLCGAPGVFQALIAQGHLIALLAQASAYVFRSKFH